VTVYKNFLLPKVQRGVFAIMIRTIAVVSAIVLMPSCAHSLKIDGFPQGSTVHLISLKSNKEVARNIGKTPVTVPKSKFDSESIVLEFRAGGYLSKRVVVPLIAGGDTLISANLDRIDQSWFLEQMLGGFAQSFSESLQDLLKLSAAITARNTPAVDALVKEFGQKYETISAYHVLMGHREMFEGRLVSARQYYVRALELEPKNTEAQEVLNQLDGSKGSLNESLYKRNKPK
jgi:hypothetical protein